MYLIPKTCTRTCSIFRISVCGIPIFSKNRHPPGQSETVTGHAHAPRGFRRASQRNRDATRFDSIRFDSIYEYHGGKTAEIFHSKVAPGKHRVAFVSGTLHRKPDSRWDVSFREKVHGDREPELSSLVCRCAACNAMQRNATRCFPGATLLWRSRGRIHRDRENS